MGRGCFVLACLIAIFLVAVGLGYHLIATRIRHEHFTSSSAGKIPIETGNAADFSALSKRMDAFKHAAPGSNATLVLTAHDLNLLISYRPEWAGVRGKLTVHIKGNDVIVIGSIPLSSIPDLRDQFANGTLRFKPSIDKKELHLTVQDIKSESRELTGVYLQIANAYVESQLTNRLLGDPVIGTVLIAAETMKIEDGALVLTRSAD